MKKSLLQIIACPLCKSSLHFNEQESVLVCCAERLAYPVEGDLPILLETSARQLSVDETNRLAGRARSKHGH